MAISRTAVETRKACEVRRFWQFDWDGTGLEPEEPQVATVTGQWGHAVITSALKGGDPEDELANVPDYGDHWIAAEQAALVRVLCLGWLRYRLPALLVDYEFIVSEEPWRDWDIGLSSPFPLRVDQLWRRRDDGRLLILDTKFFAGIPYNWTDLQKHSLQSQLYVEGVEQLLGEPVLGIQYEALLKGQYRPSGKAFGGRKIQQSPLLYGWSLPDGTPLGAYRTGAQRTILYREPDWIERIDEPLWRQQFSTLPPIRPAPEERKLSLQALVARERDYAQRLVPVLSKPAAQQREAALAVLERNDDQCFKYGQNHPCAYYAPCRFVAAGRDPLNSGYGRREDHHAEEGDE